MKKLYETRIKAEKTKEKDNQNDLDVLRFDIDDTGRFDIDDTGIGISKD